MKTPISGRIKPFTTFKAGWLSAGLLLLGCLAGSPVRATTVIYTNDFEAYTTVATGIDDAADADPVGAEWNVADDTALNPATAGAGVQVINWLAHSGTKSLLLRSSSEAQVFFTNAKSGTNYVLDFWVHAVRGAGDRNWYVILRGMGADNNGDDFFAYRTDRATSSNIFYFDGIGPGAAIFVDTGADHVDNQWQHHRLVFDTAAQKCAIYVDDMNTPVVAAADLGRPDAPVPTAIRILHEGNSADDGYFAIDDVSLTVSGEISLATTFTDGFETYAARTSETDDADPAGPWITTEVDGTGSGRSLAPGKVQVVDSTVVTPHSGNKCLKVEAGQRAGASLAWGQTPQTDVQVTWWARVPASVQGFQANYLRMSLYGAEGGNTYANDIALLGYGSRDATIGDATSITYFTTVWVDTTIDYTPDTWEQYRLTTHNSQGRYTIVKNPSGANPQVVVDRANFLGAAANWGPTFMAAWSSSNGTNHPPAYIDDIEVKSLVSNPDPLAQPYTIQIAGDRFTNVTKLSLSGPIGAMAVDPRDNSTIVFMVDAATGGTIQKATKVASGNWAVDPTPLVTGLANPSGITIAPDGTLWWVHDFTAAVMRLKWPWTSNTPEQVISDFVLPDAVAFGLDDDTFDLTFPSTNFNGTLGQSNLLVIMDRGVDDNTHNTLFLLDPATTNLFQTNYTNYLFGPTTSGMGGADLVGMTALSAPAEVVTLNFDGQVTAVNADGVSRFFWPDFYLDPLVPIAPASIAADPVTGRLWIADDLTNEVWSCQTDGSGGQRELSFPLINASRPDQQIDFQEPGMKFSPDGKLLVIADTSTANGGGRLLIFHNEVTVTPAFTITAANRLTQGFQLVWQSAGSARYDVLRGTNVGNAASFTAIATNLNATQFTDTNAPAGGAFYRVVAKP